MEKNADRLKGMLEARGIETHLLSVAGRGPIVFGKLESENAKRTVIFYAHYDGQPVDPSAWTDKSPFTPVLRDNSIEAGGNPNPLPGRLAPLRSFCFRCQIPHRRYTRHHRRAPRTEHPSRRQSEVYFGRRRRSWFHSSSTNPAASQKSSR